MGVSGPLLNRKDFNLGVVRSCLDLDSTATGVMTAENEGKIEEPCLGILCG